MISEIIIGEETRTGRGKLVTTLASINKEYTISFDMKVKLKDYWGIHQTILHFTSGNMEKYEDRIPGVWVVHKKLIIDFGVRERNAKRTFKSGIEYAYPTDLEDQKWITLEISQSLEDEKARRYYPKHTYASIKK